MKISDDVLKMIKKHLGYSDGEIKLFSERPENGDILAKAPVLMNKTIIFEVIESAGCNSGHRVGDRFYLDGSGNLLTKLNPKKICIFALSSLSGFVFAAHELVYAGADPDGMRFKSTGCIDVGVKCGGWGHIVLKCSVVDRKSA
jgi:uncharacterized repeat protein (TIGR04076 family)